MTVRAANITPTRNVIGLSSPVDVLGTRRDGELSPWRSVLPPAEGRQTVRGGIGTMPPETAQKFEALQAQAQRLMTVFARAGYEPVAPAVIQPAGLFLDVVGESLRARTYVFTDPDGEELCLRPDLTVPTCRLHLARYADGSVPARYCYSGSAFRYQPAGAGSAHPREFRQAGIESFAAADREQDDAAVVATHCGSAARSGSGAVHAAHGRSRPVQCAARRPAHAGALAPSPQAPVLAAGGVPRRAGAAHLEEALAAQGLPAALADEASIRPTPAMPPTSSAITSTSPASS